MLLWHEQYAATEPPSVAHVEPYWKSLWGGNAQRNGYGERRNISNIVWMFLQIVGIASFLLEAYVSECTGSGEINNY